MKNQHKQPPTFADGIIFFKQSSPPRKRGAFLHLPSHVGRVKFSP